MDISITARSLQPGELVVVTIAAPVPPAAAVHVRAFDHDWPAYPVGEAAWRALVGIDLDTAPGAYAVAIRVDGPAGVRRGTRPLTVAPKAASSMVSRGAPMAARTS